MSAKAVNDEATQAKLVVTVGEGDERVTLELPRKWKRFKFLKALNAGDVPGALTAAFGEDQVEPLFDLDVDEGEFMGVMEAIAENLGGTNQGN